jgi:ADP-heptose:LPS heptosyltransferase
LDDGRKLSEHFHLFHHQAVDLCGRLSLDEYITLISSSYALVAASTGPLHIAAACGIRAIGLYSPMRPIHPGRWKPIGKQAFFIEAPSHPVNREYLDIAPDEVMRLLSKP